MSSSPKQGQIEIDEAEAKLVKDIFKLRSKGLSLAKIGAKYGFSKQKVDYILKNKDVLKDLLELMVYYNLSVPTGQEDECTIILRDASSQIETPTVIYKLTDELYVYLYLLANKVTANLYKLAEDDTTIQQ